jgi:hypothetical protein
MEHVTHPKIPVDRLTVTKTGIMGKKTAMQFGKELVEAGPGIDCGIVHLIDRRRISSGRGKQIHLHHIFHITSL